MSFWGRLARWWSSSAGIFDSKEISIVESRFRATTSFNATRAPVCLRQTLAPCRTARLIEAWFKEDQIWALSTGWQRCSWLPTIHSHSLASVSELENNWRFLGFSPRTLLWYSAIGSSFGLTFASLSGTQLNVIYLTQLGAPGLTTRNKDAIRSKDATRGLVRKTFICLTQLCLSR